MEKATAIKKISDKFNIPENEITELLQSTSLPKKIRVEPKAKIVSKLLPAIIPEKKHPPHISLKKYLFTKDDYNSLIKQIETITNEIKRLGDEIGDSVSDSKTFHDNFEYEELGRQQKMWTARLHSLTEFRKNVEIVEIKKNFGVVTIGSKVEVTTEDGKILTKTIGSYITFSEDNLSYNSPLGKLLMGKRVGEKVHGKIENQSFSFEIKKIY